MPRSLFTPAYRQLIEALVAARKEAGLTQVQLSARLGRPQPFISYVERGERRIDVIEFIVIARALRKDPFELLSTLIEQLPEDLTL